MDDSLMEDEDSVVMDTTDASRNSTLNNNVEFSKLDLSGRENADFSITLDDTERSFLQKQRPIDSITIAADTTKSGNAAELMPTVDQPTDGVYFQQPLIEVGRRLWPSTSTAQNYIKGCLWSPDGTCLLVPVHLDGMHVIELPLHLYNMSAEKLQTHNDVVLHELPSAVHVKDGGTVYDIVWYPFMSSNKPETCCWLATRQHEPIHMWDAFSGELRCSYRGYDDVDEVEAAISLTFSNNGEQVIGGYKKSIKVFNTNAPGRDFSAIKVKQAVSCFALTADSNDTLTAGSWSGYINHYDLRAAHLGSLFTLGGHTGGITWLRYAPSNCNSWMLFSGARKDGKVLQWDMRNYQQPVREFARTVATNQRIYFDLSPQQHWLASGDTRGILHAWNLCDESELLELNLHNDCLNGVNFHPALPILATTSGQYHFTQADEADVNVSGGADSVDADAEQSETERIVDYENALMLLWLGAHSLG